MSERTRTEVRGNGQASPEELEQEMAATRAEMSETLAALSQRLSPETLFHQAMEQFGGTGEFANNLSEAVKRNPVPAALTGIGLGWLMVAHRQGWSTRASTRSSHGPGVSEQMKQRGTGAVQGGREKMEQARHGTSESAYEMRERAEEFNARARARISKATESARGWSTQARSQGADAGRRAGDFFQEQPLVVGALAVGIGALLGASVQKRSEPEELTRTREELSHRAQDSASEALERGGEVARAAGEAATEKTREVSSREGGTPHGGLHGREPGSS